MAFISAGQSVDKSPLQLPDGADLAPEAGSSRLARVALDEPEEVAPAHCQDSDDTVDLPQAEGLAGLEEQPPSPRDTVIAEQADWSLVDRVSKAGSEDAAKPATWESNHDQEKPHEQDTLSSGAPKEAPVEAGPEIKVMLPAAAVSINVSQLTSVISKQFQA